MIPEICGSDAERMGLRGFPRTVFLLSFHNFDIYSKLRMLHNKRQSRPSTLLRTTFPNPLSNRWSDSRSSSPSGRSTSTGPSRPTTPRLGTFDLPKYHASSGYERSSSWGAGSDMQVKLLHAPAHARVQHLSDLSSCCRISKVHLCRSCFCTLPHGRSACLRGWMIFSALPDNSRSKLNFLLQILKRRDPCCSTGWCS